MISAERIFSIQDNAAFNDLALEIFHHQFKHNQVYKKYVELIGKENQKLKSYKDIPFLPIRFFKSHRVISGNADVQKVFTSSGTTGLETSQHFVTDIALYHQSLLKGFHRFYGDFDQYSIFALLPSYLERDGSSLIEMVKLWMDKAGKGDFYLYDHQKLHADLLKNENEQRKSILIGVSYALLDFVEKYQMNLNHTIVVETGGMKGKKKELTKSELHQRLKKGFGVAEIHSEYGMTELLSQAYSQGNFNFKTPPWMRVLTRDTEDPLTILSNQKTGGINVIDLANLNACSFIATDDLGITYDDHSFEILGRFDHSDVRGCNLMVSEL